MKHRCAFQSLIIIAIGMYLVGCPGNSSNKPRIIDEKDLQRPEIKRILTSLAPEQVPYISNIYSKNEIVNQLRITQVWSAVAIGIELNENTEMQIEVAFWNPPDVGQVPMQLMITAAAEGPPGTKLGIPGHPKVICFLNDEQAEQVVANGVPDQLIETMVKTALDNDWQPEESTVLDSKDYIVVEVNSFFNE